MVYEFEGKTEKDAIEKAMQELGIERDSFDVEILEAQRGGLFKKGYVKIRLYTDDYSGEETRHKPHGKGGGQRGNSGVSSSGGSSIGRESSGNGNSAAGESGNEGGDDGNSKNSELSPVENDEFDAKMVEFLSALVGKLGVNGSVKAASRNRKKLILNIETDDSSIIIGRRGKHIDALQLLVSIYASKFVSNIKVVVDCGNYRQNHEDSLIRLANSVAAKVKQTRHSILLDPMNPYDRRIIHTTIGDSPDIDTTSEGEGIFKQVRVSYKR